MRRTNTRLRLMTQLLRLLEVESNAYALVRPMTDEAEETGMALWALSVELEAVRERYLRIGVV